ncbi:MAG: CotH kinase family protein, partial [Planctomycetales bacterium]|nr:CotH kinase family protein [Planctomycetales bacterium]
YPIFGPDAATSFSTLTVDARLNNVWTYSGGSEPTGQRGRALYMRDEYAADLQNAAGGLAPHGNHVHVYINGVYWGLHTLHERPDDSFNASYQGGDNDDFDSIKHNTSPSNVLNGTNENYLALLSLVREDMSDQANYQAVADKLDIEQFITYMMVNQYGGNQDWAHQNWYASYNRVDPNGKWQFHSWDAEKVLTGVNDNVVTKNDSGGPTEIFTRLSSNEEFRQLFMDLAHKHFFHGGTFTVERATELFQIRVDEIDSAIRAESARWGDNQQSRPYTRLDWLDNVNSYLNTYFPRRTDIVLAQYQRRNLWVTEDKLPPTFMINGQEQYGGYAAVGSSLTMSAAAGTIYYTTNGSDPRLPGGDISADALTYSSALPVNGITQVKARLRTADGSWSPLSNATFSDAVPADGSNLRISEINYHPGDPTPAEEAAGIGDADEFEFIELVNISNQTIDLSNVAFRQVAVEDAVEGIQFQFADGDVATLAAGQRLVVVENIDAFRLRYGNDPLVAGEWSGKLGNSSEPILLVAGETEIHNFIYSDDWHASTDGDGKTLQSINESGELAAWGTASGWRASSVDGGTPGQADEGRIPGDSNGDGIFNSSDLVIVFTAGEYEDAIAGNSVFEEGDWNGDGDFNTSDLVFAFQAGTYVANAVATSQQAFIAPDLSDRFGATKRKHDVIAKQAYFATVTENQTPPAVDLAPIRFEQIDQAFAEASSSSAKDTDESNELDRLIQELLQG